MSIPRDCPACGGEVPGDAPGGLCPSCLLDLSTHDSAAPTSPLGDGPRGVDDECKSRVTLPHDGSDRLDRTFEPRTLGDYELLGLIARGGMGVVYRARQISLNREVAVKMIRTSRFASRQEVRRFRTEAEVAARLDHPNLVPIYEVGEHEGEYFYSMKLIEGPNLARMASGLDVREAVGLTAKIARAVHAAHQLGVLHRDLKPENILIDPAGEPHVTDFGLAMDLGEASAESGSGVVMGTPHYMPPEQAAGRRSLMSTAADVYGLGAVLYRLLTGRPPFEGDSAVEILQKVVNRSPDPPRDLNRAVDRDLETICLKCLEKDPKDRYGSAEALAQDLDRWLRIEPIEARPISTTERVAKWARRRPSVAAAAAAVVVTSVAGLATVLFLWREAAAGRLAATENETRVRFVAKEAQAQAKSADDQRIRAEEARAKAEDRAEALRRDKYALDLGRARLAWENSHPFLLSRALDAAASKIGQSDLRGWEWYYLKGMSDQFASPRQRQGPRFSAGALRGIAYWKGQLHLAAGGAGGVQVWDTRNPGKDAFVGAASFQRGVLASAFSPDGRLLALSLVRGGILLVDLAKPKNSPGDPIGDSGRPVYSLAFDAESRRLAAGGGDRVVQVWDVASKKLAATSPELAVNPSCLAFDPKGQALVCGGLDGSVQTWEVGTSALQTSPSPQSRKITCLAFQPDGNAFASGSLDRTIRVRDVATGTVRPGFDRFDGPVLALSYSRDGKALAVGGEGRAVLVLDAETGEPRQALHGRMMKTVRALVFHPDPNPVRLVVGFEDASMVTWDLSAPLDGLIVRGEPAIAASLAFEPGETGRLAIASVTVLDSLQRSRVGDGGLVLLDRSGVTAPRNHRPSLANVSLARPGTERGGLALSADGSRLALLDPKGPVKIWDVVGRRLLKSLTPPPGALLSCMALDQRGARLAAGRLDGTVLVWNLATPEPKPESIKNEEGDPVLALAFDPEARRLAASRGGGARNVVRVWDLDDNARPRDQPLNLNLQGRTPLSLAFSPDGKQLAAGTGRLIRSAGSAGQILLWNLSARGEPRVFEGPDSTVWALAFHPDGNRLASGTEDRTVRVWDLTSGLEVHRFEGNDGPVVGLAFSPDRRRLAAVDQGGTTRVWTAASMPPIPTSPGP